MIIRYHKLLRSQFQRYYTLHTNMYLVFFRYTGNYPLHFHMCGDVDDREKPSLLSGNSIRDSFARCITVHGSHGAQVGLTNQINSNLITTRCTRLKLIYKCINDEMLFFFTARLYQLKDHNIHFHTPPPPILVYKKTCSIKSMKNIFF